MNAQTRIIRPFPTPSQFTASRLLLEAAVQDVERWERRLGEINRGNVADPEGNEGARLESLILRGQAIIGKESTHLLGIDVARADRARGVAL